MRNRIKQQIKSNLDEAIEALEWAGRAMELIVESAEKAGCRETEPIPDFINRLARIAYPEEREPQPRVFHVVSRLHTITFLDYDAMKDWLGNQSTEAALNGEFVVLEHEVTPQEYTKLSVMAGATT